MVKQKEIANYVRQAGDGLPFAVRRKLKADLQNSLSDFLDMRPDRTMDDVIEHFGTSEKFMDEYVLAMEPAERRNLLCKAKWFKRIVGIGMAAIVLTIAVTAIWIVCENSRTAGYYYYEEVERTK